LKGGPRHKQKMVFFFEKILFVSKCFFFLKRHKLYIFCLCPNKNYGKGYQEGFPEENLCRGPPFKNYGKGYQVWTQVFGTFSPLFPEKGQGRDTRKGYKKTFKKPNLQRDTLFKDGLHNVAILGSVACTPISKRDTNNERT